MIIWLHKNAGAILKKYLYLRFARAGAFLGGIFDE
jgi:hypothetical protein